MILLYRYSVYNKRGEIIILRKYFHPYVYCGTIQIAKILNQSRCPLMAVYKKLYNIHIHNGVLFRHRNNKVVGYISKGLDPNESKRYL